VRGVLILMVNMEMHIGLARGSALSSSMSAPNSKDALCSLKV